MQQQGAPPPRLEPLPEWPRGYPWEQPYRAQLYCANSHRAAILAAEVAWSQLEQGVPLTPELADQRSAAWPSSSGAMARRLRKMWLAAPAACSRRFAARRPRQTTNDYIIERQKNRR